MKALGTQSLQIWGSILIYLLLHSACCLKIHLKCYSAGLPPNPAQLGWRVLWQTARILLFSFILVERMGAYPSGRVHQALAVPRFTEQCPQPGLTGIFLLPPGWWGVHHGGVSNMAVCPLPTCTPAKNGPTLPCCDPSSWSCFGSMVIRQTSSNHGCLDTVSVVKWCCVHNGSSITRTGTTQSRILDLGV